MHYPKSWIENLFCSASATNSRWPRSSPCSVPANNQAELDLLLFRKGQRLGFEVKYTDAPKVTSSQRMALETLRLDSLTLVCPGDASYPLGDLIRVQGLPHVIQTRAELA